MRFRVNNFRDLLLSGEAKSSEGKKIYAFKGKNLRKGLKQKKAGMIMEQTSAQRKIDCEIKRVRQVLNF